MDCDRYEKDFTYDTFAAALLRDAELPECFHKRIAASIGAQVDKAKRSLPWYQAVSSESLHPIFVNIRLNDTILMDRFEVRLVRVGSRWCCWAWFHVLRDGWELAVGSEQSTQRPRALCPSAV